MARRSDRGSIFVTAGGAIVNTTSVAGHVGIGPSSPLRGPKRSRWPHARPLDYGGQGVPINAVRAGAQNPAA
jgi:hypothetical protein